MKIQVKSPTRVDLAGGTLDLWPLYMLIENSTTINLSINIFTYCDLTPRDDQKISLDISDLNAKFEFSNFDELLNCNDSKLTLIKTVVEHFRPTSGFDLDTKSESPVGGGLGGSSSLMVSILTAFNTWLDKNPTLVDLVMTAKDLEAKVLKTPTGMQDYIPAASVGLNIIDHSPLKPKINCLDVDRSYFSDRLVLVDTGKAHHSGINNWQVYKAFIDGDEHTARALNKIRDVATLVKAACEQSDWQQLPSLFKQEFEARMMLSSAFSSPEIERLEKLVLQHGAEAVKICGAGGGGSVLVWTAPENKQKVIEACQSDGFQVLKIEPA